jgi:hypothetical protein
MPKIMIITIIMKHEYKMGTAGELLSRRNNMVLGGEEH